MSVNLHALGGIVLDEADGSKVVINTKGLDDAPEIRSGIESRSQQDGGWDADGFYGPRVIQLEGFAASSTSADAHAFADSLRALSPATLHLFAVDSPGRGTRQAMVRMQAGAVVEWIGDDTFRYVLTVIAPDPLLYGMEAYASTTLESGTDVGVALPATFPIDFGTAGTTPGAAQLPNAGTAGYFPSFRLDGPMPNPVVTVNETGEWVRWAGTVLASQWLEIDCGRRRILLNGSVDVTYLASTSATWPSIPPGGASVSIAADAGDPSALLSAYGFEGAWS